MTVFSVSTVSAVVEALLEREVSSMSVVELDADCAELATVAAWVSGRKVAQCRRYAELAELAPSIDAEEHIAEVSRAGRRDAEQTVRRVAVLDQVPELEDGLVRGEVSGAHVDVLGRAINRLEAGQRELLTADGDRLLQLAQQTTPEHFAGQLNAMVRRLQADGGIGLLERQQRATRLRMWLDREIGMYRIAGELDPESGLLLRGRVDNAIDALFHDRHPDTCPEDPKDKQDHLRALALVALTAAGRIHPAPEDITLVGRNTEIAVVIDLPTIVDGLHQQSLIDHGDDGHWLPVETYLRMACLADIVPVVLDGNGVALHVGRERRLATRAQRRALRSMYQTCAVPGCTVRSRHCQPHHIHWWHNGGPTDLDNLLPLCSKHHHRAHEGGWRLHLHPDRSLTITYPDGTTRTTAPPHTARAG